MSEIRIEAREGKQKMKPETTAAELLEKCRQFYQNPENEKAFLEWKQAKKNG